MSTNEERTFNLSIRGEANTANRSTPQRRTQTPERNQRDQETPEASNISNDMNDIQLLNRVYRKYVKNPKGIEEGTGDVDLEIMLINSLKINAGKVQEIIDSFLINNTYISVFCLTETKVELCGLCTSRISHI